MVERRHKGDVTLTPDVVLRDAEAWTAEVDFFRRRIGETVRRGHVASDECEVKRSHGDSALTTKDERKNWLGGAVSSPYATTKVDGRDDEISYVGGDER